MEDEKEKQLYLEIKDKQADVSRLQKELDNISSEKKAKLISRLKGKCFKVADKYSREIERYIKVIDIDNSGCIIVIQITSNKDNTDIKIDRQYYEYRDLVDYKIPNNEFQSMFELVMTKINDMNKW